MSTDNDFKRGSRNSSSLMSEELTPLQIQQFMETSFYLPIDVLQNRGWHVFGISVMTGEKFKQFMDYATSGSFHCVEDKELLFKANYVAVSARRKQFTQKHYYVCKIWYGAAPK